MGWLGGRVRNEPDRSVRRITSARAERVEAFEADIGPDRAAAEDFQLVDVADFHPEGNGRRRAVRVQDFYQAVRITGAYGEVDAAEKTEAGQQRLDEMKTRRDTFAVCGVAVKSRRPQRSRWRQREILQRGPTLLALRGALVIPRFFCLTPALAIADGEIQGKRKTGHATNRRADHDAKGPIRRGKVRDGAAK